MSTTRSPELRAYAIAIVLFVILHFLLLALGNSVAATATGVETWMPYINVLAYLLYILTGFVAGALARRRHVLNGMITGFLAAATAVLLFGAAPGFNLGTVVLLLNGVIFGGMGGACSMMLGQEKVTADRSDSSGPAN